MSRYAILLLALILGSPVANAGQSRGETLRAADVVVSTNVDWMALARAHQKIRAGEKVSFEWHSSTNLSYAEIRRALWLAALHGITDQTSAEERTRRLMKDELELVKLRLQVPFAIDVAVRSTSTVERLIPMLIRSQVACSLVSLDEPVKQPTVLRCQGDEVLSEKSSVVFTSLPMAVNFTQACHTDNGLVFDENDRLATDVFIRRFRDGTATVVNLTNRIRRELIYRRGLRSIPFDLPPAGVLHILSTDPPRLSRDCNEPFICGLWHITFSGSQNERLVPSQMLPTVVDETYEGTIRYKTTVTAPTGEEALFLHLDVANSETQVTIDGHPLGTRAWDPFEWLVPISCRGKTTTLEIQVEKKTLDGFLQSQPKWHRR